MSALSGLSGLQLLDLSRTGVTDVSALSGLSGLQFLDLSWTGVTDVSALSGLSGLRSLYLHEARVTDVSALAHLPDLKIYGLAAPKQPPAVPPAVESASSSAAGFVPYSEDIWKGALTDRFKLKIDDPRWLFAVLAVEDPGISVTGVSRDLGFVAVARPAGVSEDQFRSILETLCARFGGHLIPEFRYDLEDEPTFDPTFAVESPDAVATLDDVLVRIRARNLHNHRSENVVIAVVDTGVDGTRLEFQTPGKIVPGWAPPSEDPWTDYLGHGTMCACIAAGAAGARFAGVAPHAKLMSCRSTFVDGDLVLIYEQLIRLAQSGIKVVATNSFGTNSGTPPALHAGALFPTALEKAIEAGVHVVFSAGNYHALAGGAADACSPNSIWLHKGRADVMTVGTCDLDGRMWSYSSRGPGQFPGTVNTAAKPDVVAPTPRNGLIAYGGGERVSANGWGTSGAAPQVAGLIALLLSARPDLPRDELYAIVRETAVCLGHGRTCQGHGMIDCTAAIDRVLDGTLTEFA
ncbi:S8 family serine peptidase [Azospirillum sp. sgz301742]